MMADNPHRLGSSENPYVLGDADKGACGGRPGAAEGGEMLLSAVYAVQERFGPQAAGDALLSAFASWLADMVTLEGAKKMLTDLSNALPVLYANERARRAGGGSA